MSTYRFHPMPNARGGFTTRVALGERVSQATLLERAAAAAGLTPEQTGAAVQAFLREILTAAEDTQWCDDLFGLARFTPLAGGTSPDPAGFRTADDLAAGVSLAFTAEAIRQWRSRLSLASQGLLGKATPVIASVMCCQTDRQDTYTSPGIIALCGERLKIDWHDPEQGFFLTLEDGREVRCSPGGPSGPRRNSALIPPDLTGPVRLRVTVRLKGTLRTTTYGIPLEPSGWVAP